MELNEFLRGTLGVWLMPVPVVLTLLGIGLLLLWPLRRPRRGWAVVALATVLLGALSTPLVSQRLAAPLEATVPMLAPEEAPAVRWVVVLGAAHIVSDHRPITSKINATGVVRLLEGIRQWRSQPEAMLVVGGRGSGQPITYAQMAGRLLRAFGVPPGRIRMLNSPTNTAEEAAAARALIGAEPFILVTSASHMPRAIAAYRARGMNPIPAPTHYFTGDHYALPTHLTPGADNLYVSSAAWHEYLGLLWQKLVSLF
jgi:uncharacterized SAM-binding protein YcdF (DUF218 family)